MKLFPLAALASLLLACGPYVGQAQFMTMQEVREHGTAHYSAPYDKVFHAAVGALRAEGYEIAVENRERGLVRTSRKPVRSAAVGGNGYAQAITYTRQFALEITAARGGIDVVAKPFVFGGEQDLSQQQVWDLDSPAGERALWARLFRLIGESL